MIPILYCNISSANITCYCTSSGVRISIQPLHLVIIHTVTMRIMRLNLDVYLRLCLWSTTLAKILATCIAVMEPIGTSNISSAVITCNCYCSRIRIMIAPSHCMSIVAQHRGWLYLHWVLRKNWKSLNWNLLLNRRLRLELRSLTLKYWGLRLLKRLCLIKWSLLLKLWLNWSLNRLALIHGCLLWESLNWRLSINRLLWLNWRLPINRLLWLKRRLPIHRLLNRHSKLLAWIWLHSWWINLLLTSLILYQWAILWRITLLSVLVHFSNINFENIY
jgi:hypothetical protein